ncbi:MAG: flavodoxin-dependent (E)-4-hydroxy-3-methylbut-2-enyl-diphosphate synthase [Oscillospiraceae bacterium]|nr:flavodoxin-dependent (E)-4-hydroxy-3-methylbut-2-enyl-diphosphate synthase [Oscillospiraceae bacterium]
MRKQIIVGGVAVGGDAPISVQSMTNTQTCNVTETIAQIHRLEDLGCDIIRVAVPDMESADAIGEIKAHIHIPLVADIHFDHKLAIRAAEAGADKIRINPGNIGGAEHARQVAEICKKKGLPIRIGVNGGSLSSEILQKYNGVTPEAMLESAMGHIMLLNRFDFDDICVSVKASSVPLTVASYRLLYERTNYPLHIGVTEAGTEYAGIIKSSMGIGALLLEGIGNTIRVSLTAPPECEVKAAIEILKALGLRRGYELISCPTCGRCGIDLIPIAEAVEHRLEQMYRVGQAQPQKDISVAVMGCVVNGPGEASRADFGIAGGVNEGIIFAGGKILKKVSMTDLVQELFELIRASDSI